MVSCAYVYENGEYVYKKSFENIPNYRIDNSEKLKEDLESLTGQGRYDVCFKAMQDILGNVVEE